MNALLVLILCTLLVANHSVEGKRKLFHHSKSCSRGSHSGADKTTTSSTPMSTGSEPSMTIIPVPVVPVPG
ncbi:Hypothetical predicted protein [Mytilus galloprovincialis]|uniref:Uncharacterized protein n=1 Tax=Mytilus galloprovincialis TaxID=29158 RepID=A0A8B6ESK2_MYTGA|nr:Hypothetical predicted protein [Mytilus galloprovincialis]